MVIERNVALVILFSILTCGIYAIYWYIVVTNEIESSLQQKDGSVPSGGMAFLFSLLTCGIYTYYWYYKQGQRTCQLLHEHNIRGEENGVLYLLLAIFSLSIVSMALIQSDLNRVAQAERGDFQNKDDGGFNY